MITIDVLIRETAGLGREDLERWISQEWVRPDRRADGYVFRDIDVARVRLILEMRDHMDVGEPALPVVLSLLDQLYDMRRQMRDLAAAVAAVAPLEVRRDVAEHLSKRSAPGSRG